MNVSSSEQRFDTVVIGGGQSGLAMSYYLTQLGKEHLILERGRLAERWRSERWDSLTLLTPNWLTQLPGAEYKGDFRLRSAPGKHNFDTPHGVVHGWTK